MQLHLPAYVQCKLIPRPSTKQPVYKPAQVYETLRPSTVQSVVLPAQTDETRPRPSMQPAYRPEKERNPKTGRSRDKDDFIKLLSHEFTKKLLTSIVQPAYLPAKDGTPMTGRSRNNSDFVHSRECTKTRRPSIVQPGYRPAMIFVKFAKARKMTRTVRRSKMSHIYRHIYRARRGETRCNTSSYYRKKFNRLSTIPELDESTEEIEEEREDEISVVAEKEQREEKATMHFIAESLQLLHSYMASASPCRPY